MWHLQSLNREIFAALTAAHFRVDASEPPGTQGWMNFRLYGWCALQFGTLDLTFEVNDRYPNQHLESRQIQTVGYILFQQLQRWAAGETGRAQHAERWTRLQQRRQARVAYFTRLQCDPEQKTPYDLLIHGY